LSISHISVVMIAKNAEETIVESLESLIDFYEVILYLNNSVDATKEMASSYKNVMIIEGEFIGFGKTKNKAAEFSTNNWILSLDSDEVLNKELIKEIDKHDYHNPKKLYRLKRDNYFLGGSMVGKDNIVRIYNKNFTRFDDALVHEKVLIPSEAEVIDLKQSFKHLNITNINQTLSKMIKYTDLGAKDKKTCFFIVVILKAMFAFIQTYFLRFYFMNGWRGFTVAVSNANRRFYKYLKQYINCKQI